MDDFRISEQLKRIADSLEKIAEQYKQANDLKIKELRQKGVIPDSSGHY